METGAGHKTNSNTEGAVRRLSVGLDLCAKALYTPLYSSLFCVSGDLVSNCVSTGRLSNQYSLKASFWTLEVNQTTLCPFPVPFIYGFLYQ